MGTVEYLAPEQALDPRSVDGRADLYGLGCTFFFVLTGGPPFFGGTMTRLLLRHQQEEPPDVERLRPDLPPAATDVLRRLLAKRPSERPASAAEVADALAPLAAWDGPLPAAGPDREAAAGDGTVATSGASPPAAPPRRGPTLCLPVDLGAEVPLTVLPGRPGDDPVTVPPVNPWDNPVTVVPAGPAATARDRSRVTAVLSRPARKKSRRPANAGWGWGAVAAGVLLPLVLVGGIALLLWLLWPAKSNRTEAAERRPEPGRAAPPPPVVQPPAGNPWRPDPVPPVVLRKRLDRKFPPGAMVHTAEEVAGMPVLTLTLDAAKIARCLCWAADGKSFYHLGGGGLLRRVNLATFQEEARLQTDARCTWLSPSREGLVLTVASAHEIWLLDPGTLQPRKQIPFSCDGLTVSAPPLSFAFATGPEGNNLYVLDLKTGETTQRYPGTFRQQGISKSLAVTSDGKYLFAVGGMEQLFRYDIAGGELSLAESSSRIAQGRMEGIDLSLDGKMVCLPTGGGNYSLKQPGQAAGYHTYLFAVDDLRTPVVTVQQGAYPQAVGFDPKRRRYYSQSYKHQLMIFNERGLPFRQLELGGGHTRQILVHPDGRRLLLLTEERLYCVELPAD
jgi:hypothetical protein